LKRNDNPGGYLQKTFGSYGFCGDFNESLIHDIAKTNGADSMALSRCPNKNSVHCEVRGSFD